MVDPCNAACTHVLSRPSVPQVIDWASLDCSILRDEDCVPSDVASSLGGSDKITWLLWRAPDAETAAVIRQNGWGSSGGGGSRVFELHPALYVGTSFTRGPGCVDARTLGFPVWSDRLKVYNSQVRWSEYYKVYNSDARWQPHGFDSVKVELEKTAMPLTTYITRATECFHSQSTRRRKRLDKYGEVVHQPWDEDERSLHIDYRAVVYLRADSISAEKMSRISELPDYTMVGYSRG